MGSADIDPSARQFGGQSGAPSRYRQRASSEVLRGCSQAIGSHSQFLVPASWSSRPYQYLKLNLWRSLTYYHVVCRVLCAEIELSMSLLLIF